MKYIFLFAISIAAAPTFAADAPPRPSERFILKGALVTDTRTGLSWQRCSVGMKWTINNKCAGHAKKLDFAQAQRFNSFQSGRVSDWLDQRAAWRVPTKNEIESLVDHSQPNFKIDSKIFPDVDENNSFFWTSDLYIAEQGWYASFERGVVTYMYGDFVNAYEKMNLRLVHAEEMQSSITVKH